LFICVQQLLTMLVTDWSGTVTKVPTHVQKVKDFSSTLKDPF